MIWTFDVHDGHCMFLTTDEVASTSAKSFEVFKVIPNNIDVSANQAVVRLSVQSHRRSADPPSPPHTHLPPDDRKLKPSRGDDPVTLDQTY